MMLYRSVADLFESVTVGRNQYTWPTVTLVAGVPLMVIVLAAAVPETSWSSIPVTMPRNERKAFFDRTAGAVP